MNSNFGNAVASMLQPRNRLENQGSENNEVSRGMWKAVETGTGEVSMGETKGGRSEERSGKKAEEEEKQIKEKKNSGS